MIESIVFTKEDVLLFCEAIGEKSQLYHSQEYAKSHGLKTIPLPPTMPLIMYQHFHIPWQTEETLVHRKQTGNMHRRMYIGETYLGTLTLSPVVKRNAYTFSKQTLSITDVEGNLSYEGEFHLVTGDLQ